MHPRTTIICNLHRPDRLPSPEKLKLIIAVGGEILVELKGDNDCREIDLVSLARKVDLKILKKMK